MRKLLARCIPVSVFLSLLVVPEARAQGDLMLTQVGGGGGDAFQARCPADHVLVGFNLRAGHDIDAVQPLCAMRVGSVIGTPIELQRFGGTGGEPARVVCPANAPIVRGVRLAAQGVDGLALNNIWLYCAENEQSPLPEYPSARFDAPDHASSGGVGVGRMARNQTETTTCPAGLVGVGVFGRAGALVDALGLICGPMPFIRRGLTRGRPPTAPVINRRTEAPVGGHAGLGGSGDVELPAVGGTGGQPFAWRCQSGERLVGLSLRVGFAVENVSRICTDAVRGFGRPAPWQEGLSHGALLCPSDTPFVHGMRVTADGGDSGLVLVKEIELHCVADAVNAAPSRRAARFRLPFTQRRGYTTNDQDCPSGMVVVGIHGRVGAALDALGITCGR